jgi:hypothetical protein
MIMLHIRMILAGVMSWLMKYLILNRMRLSSGMLARNPGLLMATAENLVFNGVSTTGRVRFFFTMRSGSFAVPQVLAAAMTTA